MDICELLERLYKAKNELKELCESYEKSNSSTSFRLSGKLEGVNLAISYIQEMMISNTEEIIDGLNL